MTHSLNRITTDSSATTAEAVHLRTFEPSDLPAAHALSSNLQWAHRLEDWQFALSLGQGVVAEYNGKVKGAALSWQWGANYASIGLVIVNPELQGRRIGNCMMEALLNRLTTRDVLLHATVAGRGLYERLGFGATGEIVHFQGVPKTLPVLPKRDGSRLRPLQEGDIETLIALDARGAGMSRGELLRRLFSQQKIVVLDFGGQAVGFAVLHRFGHGHTIGPVVAPDFDAARLLIANCIRQTNDLIRIDVDTQSGLPPWLDSLGLPRVGAVTIMVRGRTPERGPAFGNWALFTHAIG